MTNQGVGAWLRKHESIFTELQEALLAATGSAGDAARAIDSGADDEGVRAALERVIQLTNDFLEVVQRARALPLIPDEKTARHFGLGLARLRDAAEAQREAANRRDATQMMRAGDAYKAGIGELYRTADALRRAGAQSPDPRNAYS